MGFQVFGERAETLESPFQEMFYRLVTEYIVCVCVFARECVCVTMRKGLTVWERECICVSVSVCVRVCVLVLSIHLLYFIEKIYYLVTLFCSVMWDHILCIHVCMYVRMMCQCTCDVYSTYIKRGRRGITQRPHTDGPQRWKRPNFLVTLWAVKNGERECVREREREWRRERKREREREREWERERERERKREKSRDEKIERERIWHQERRN